LDIEIITKTAPFVNPFGRFCKKYFLNLFGRDEEFRKTGPLREDLFSTMNLAVEQGLILTTT
jgi:hypothetical protein